MTERSGFADIAHFLRSWLSNPLRVGAIAPSGKVLARAMVRDIHPGDGPVLELGPGTGVFTQAILNRGVAPSALTMVEYGADLAALLRRRFPECRVLEMNAADLARTDLGAGPPVATVISGLPLLAMPQDVVGDILAGAFHHLRPDGAMIQFTYGPKCPVPAPVLERLGLEAEYLGRIWRNVPPAAIYRITRRKKPE
ncbi:MAG: class I SAM-dependent methyltransferase [Pseudomonadota bacterium]